MFKRIVCIITLVAVLASSLCFSAFAVEVETVDPLDFLTFDPANAPQDSNVGMFDLFVPGQDLNLRDGTYRFDAGVAPSPNLLGWFKVRVGSGGQDPNSTFLDQYYGYKLRYKEDPATLSFYEKYFWFSDTLPIGNYYETAFVTGLDVVESGDHKGFVNCDYNLQMNWFDDNATYVNFGTLSALAYYYNVFLGINCQVQFMKYVSYGISPSDTVVTSCYFLTFTGHGFGGWRTPDHPEYYDLYVLSNELGMPLVSLHSPVYDDSSSVGTPRPPASVVPNEPDDTPSPDVPDDAPDVPDDAPDSVITVDDDGNYYFYDIRSNTYIPIFGFSYTANDNKYSFCYIDTFDNSTTVNITYNIDYTQVTYIGASAEYDSYKIYYKLPDGRSSADMTAEDLEQLNLNYDVINYGKSTDDGRLRSLYHLDGNTDDSSYWVNQTSFEWVTNPSIEYLEATNFEGCLYLDEQDHAFKLKLPSKLSASDFTLQFRYYHYGYGDTENNTATNYTDLVVQAVDSVTMNAYSTLFTNLAGTYTTDSTTPIGQWSEVCIVRDGATLYTYVNGVVIDSKAFIDVLGDTLLFDFKDVSVRRQIDEIRVFNYARYVDGVSYTPITVPMDTNLVLILPDEGTLLPDGYWDFNTDGNLLSVYDFTGGSPLALTKNTSSYSLGFVVGANTVEYNAPAGKFTFVTGQEPSVTVNSDFFHISSPLNKVYNGFNSSAFNSNIPVWYWSPGQGYLSTGSATSGRTPYYVESIAHFNVAGGGSLQTYNPYNFVSGDMISYSLVFKDGTQVSSSIVVPDLRSSYNPASVVSDVKSYDWGDFGLVCSEASGGYGYYIYLVLNPNQTGFDLVYRELKIGAPNDNTDAYKTVIYSDESIKPNTIAVRSTVPVRTWRIGGVRPTLPYRGDVWALIQGNRITSIQIYTGTMWTEVDCRIWTGERWAWPNYFDILTQQDMTDINGTTDNTYIQDDTGYYSWITEQWKQLLDLLNSILDGLSNIDGGTDINLDFNFDGTISIEFDSSLEVGRNSLFELLQFLYDSVFKPAIDGLGNSLDVFSVIISPEGGYITIDGQTVESPMGIIGKEYDWEV